VVPSGPVRVRATSKRGGVWEEVELVPGKQRVTVKPGSTLQKGLGWGAMGLGTALLVAGVMDMKEESRGCPSESDCTGVGSHSSVWLIVPGAVMMVGGLVLVDMGSGEVSVVGAGK